MKILPYTPSNPVHKAALQHLLVQYFAGLNWKEPKDAIPPSYVPKILSIIAESLAQGDFWVYLARERGTLCGFVIAQIDGPDKDWCKRPGWGFIRELYVLPNRRGRGIAGRLVRRAEQSMARGGASNFYLTSDLSSFWESLGYADSGAVYPGNGGKIYTRENIT